MLALVRSTYGPYLYVLLRIIAGLLFACHGAQKLFGVFGGVGGPPGATVALFSLMGLAGIIELVGGLLIAFGVLTSPAAFIASLDSHEGLSTKIELTCATSIRRQDAGSCWRAKESAGTLCQNRPRAVGEGCVSSCSDCTEPRKVEPGMTSSPPIATLFIDVGHVLLTDSWGPAGAQY